MSGSAYIQNSRQGSLEQFEIMNMWVCTTSRNQSLRSFTWKCFKRFFKSASFCSWSADPCSWHQSNVSIGITAAGETSTPQVFAISIWPRFIAAQNTLTQPWTDCALLWLQTTTSKSYQVIWTQLDHPFLRGRMCRKQGTNYMTLWCMMLLLIPFTKLIIVPRYQHTS